MSEAKQPKIENLELNKETVQDLSEQQSEEVQGGAQLWPSTACTQSCFPTCMDRCGTTICTDHLCPTR
jgi:hypothetical protein